MIDTVFISDLHLHPEDAAITARFYDFLTWLRKQSVRRLFILGDFFHAWAGDDAMNDWSLGIATELKKLREQGIAVYFMPGNRDFLLGDDFAKQALWTVLPDPSLIILGETPVLLSHGDRYCTKDWAHQALRLLTRNRWFPPLFLHLSLARRRALVDKVRTHSMQKPMPQPEVMDVVPQALLKHMRAYKVQHLIHGHTHKPGMTTYNEGNTLRYVLSDWDDNPQVLCYNITKGIHFFHF